MTKDRPSYLKNLHHNDEVKALLKQKKENPTNWTKEEVQTYMKSDLGLAKCILRVYNNQTDQEASTGYTVENNGVGFNGSDSVFLTSIAKQIIEDKRLSNKQIFIARTMMYKYAKQIMHTI
jgi:hypothetical protein